ncbi:MAG: N-acetyltransferase [Mycoplasmataceae bacterium]|jgi:predicted GNAT family acetyltransferase|nr:N-acetyltransferase [Mycoplasmataceae bacterium]
MNKDYRIEKRNNQIIDLVLVGHAASHIRLQQIDDTTYCVISTYVDSAERGQGLGTKLYKAMLSYIHENKAKFSATCPYVAEIASNDKSVKDIYIERI